MPLYIELEAVPEAQLVGAKAPVRDTQAAYLAYRFGNEPVSLLVAPPREISMSQITCGSLETHCSFRATLKAIRPSSGRTGDTHTSWSRSRLGLWHKPA
jgi:hypothetical protein